MGTKVIVPAGYAAIEAVTGTVVGIASLHVIFSYIVLLDSPLQTEYGEWKAIVVHGPSLETPDGKNFRLE